MSNSKHTPGPWHVTNSERGQSIDAVYPDGDLVSVARISGGPEEQQANARLIAAAPDMLTALEFIRFAVTDDARNNGGRVDVEAIRLFAEEVIAQATGGAK